jgi:hypothetical protein
MQKNKLFMMVEFSGETSNVMIRIAEMKVVRIRFAQCNCARKDK